MFTYLVERDKAIDSMIFGLSVFLIINSKNFLMKEKFLQSEMDILLIISKINSMSLEGFMILLGN